MAFNYTREELEELARERARLAGIPEDLALGLIEQESRWDPGATSGKDAKGIAQVRDIALKDVRQRSGSPGFAQPELADDADLYDPQTSMDVGFSHLYNMNKLYGDEDWSPSARAHALAAYNAGSGSMDRWLDEGRDIEGGDIPFTETRDYVPGVLGRAGKYIPSIDEEEDPTLPQEDISGIDLSLSGGAQSSPFLGDIPPPPRIPYTQPPAAPPIPAEDAPDVEPQEQPPDGGWRIATLPDGATFEINSDMPLEEAFAMAKKKWPESFAGLKTQEDADAWDHLAASTGRAFGGFLPGLGALKAGIEGDEEAYDKYQQALIAESEEASERAPGGLSLAAITDIYDRDGLLAAVDATTDYAGQTIMGSLGFMAPTIASGGAGAAAGAGLGFLFAGPAGAVAGAKIGGTAASLLGSMGTFLSENMESLYAEGGIDTKDVDALTQIGAAGAQAGLNLLSYRLAGSGLAALGMGGRRGIAGAAENVLARLDRTTGLKKVAAGLGLEEVTELSQEALERYASGAEVSPFDPEARSQYAEVMFGTLFPGTLFGSVGAGTAKVGELRDRRLEKLNVDKNTRRAEVRRTQDKLIEDDRAKKIEEEAAAIEDDRAQQVLAVQQQNRRAASEQENFLKGMGAVQAAERMARQEQLVRDGSVTVDDIHQILKDRNIVWDNDPGFQSYTKRITGELHLDDLVRKGNQAGMDKLYRQLASMPVQDSPTRLQLATNDSAIDAAEKIGTGKVTDAKLAKYLKMQGPEISDENKAEIFEAYRRRMLDLGVAKLDDNGNAVVNSKKRPVARDLYDQIITDARDEGRFLPFMSFGRYGIRSRKLYDDIVGYAIARGDIEVEGDRLIPSVPFTAPGGVPEGIVERYEYRVNERPETRWVIPDPNKRGEFLSIEKTKSAADAKRKKLAGQGLWDLVIGGQVVASSNRKADVNRAKKEYSERLREHEIARAKTRLRREFTNVYPYGLTENQIDKRARSEGSASARIIMREQGVSVEQKPIPKPEKRVGFEVSESRLFEDGRVRKNIPVAFRRTFDAANNDKARKEERRIGRESWGGKVSGKRKREAIEQVRRMREKPAEVAAEEFPAPGRIPGPTPIPAPAWETTAREEAELKYPPLEGEFSAEEKKRVDDLTAEMVKLVKPRSLRGLKVQFVKSLTNPGNIAEFDGTRNIINIALTDELVTADIDAASSRVATLLNHETVHYLKSMGAFTKKEWSVLEKYVENKALPGYLRDAVNREHAKSGKDQIPEGATFLDLAKAQYPAKDWDSGQIMEEAVARAFEFWSRDKSVAPGQPGGLMNRITTFFRKLGEGLRAMGFTNADSVFESLYGDKYGQRIEAGKVYGDYYSSRPKMVAMMEADLAIREGIQDGPADPDRAEAPVDPNPRDEPQPNAGVAWDGDRQGYSVTANGSEISFAKVRPRTESERRVFDSDRELALSEASGIKEKYLNDEEAKRNAAQAAWDKRNRDELGNLRRDRSPQVMGARNHGLRILQSKKKPKELPKRPKVKEVAKYFSDPGRHGAPITYDGSTSAQRKRFEDRLYDEVIHAMESHPDAAGWYDANLGLAMDILKELDPEIVKPENNLMFKIILANTSDGAAVDDQFNQTWKVYKRWKDRGGFDARTINLGDVKGSRVKNIRPKVRFAHNLIREHGHEKIEEWLTRRSSVTDIRRSAVEELGLPSEMAAKIGGGELTTEVLPHSIIFGPKLGSFFNNLYGNYDTTTMDRWFMRLVGRISGTQYSDPTPQEIKEKLDRFNNAFRGLGKRDRKMLGLEGRKALSIKDADKVSSFFADADARAMASEGSALEEFRLAGNGYHKLIKEGGLIEAPKNGSHRRWIRERVAAVQDRLKQAGVEIENADLQALLWYNEKELYNLLGVQGRKKGSDDYASSAASLYERVSGRPSRVYARGSGRVGRVGGRTDAQGLGQPARAEAKERRGRGSVTGSESRAARAIPAPEAAGRTQRSNTKAAYEGARKSIPTGSKVIDFGAGSRSPLSKRGPGKSTGGVVFKRGYDYVSYEPFASDWDPDHSSIETLMAQHEGTADAVVNNLVLNVVPPDSRASIVESIGRLLAPDGKAYLAVRPSQDVNAAKIKEPSDLEDGGWIVGRGDNRTYQKGFTQPEFLEYISEVLGPDFSVERSTHAPKANPQVVVTRLPAGTNRVMGAVETGVGRPVESVLDEYGEIDEAIDTAAHALARDADMGITRDRDLSSVVRDENGEVIGAQWRSFDGDNYEFDVVVAPEHQGSGVGRSLIDDGIAGFDDHLEFNPDATMRLSVTSDVSEAALSRRGFEVVGGDNRIKVMERTPRAAAKNPFKGLPAGTNRVMGAVETGTFNDGIVDDVLASKLNLDDLPRARGGSVRRVFDLGDGRVVKVATHPRGLEQNASMGMGDKGILGDKIPEMYESGLDYIVMEKVPRNDKATRRFLKPLQKFSSSDWDNKTSELQEVLSDLGLDEFMNYDLLWNDFIAPRNWGQRADGSFVLVDEGALNKDVTATSKVQDWARDDWEKVKRLRKGEGWKIPTGPSQIMGARKYGFIEPMDRDADVAVRRPGQTERSLKTITWGRIPFDDRGNRVKKTWPVMVFQGHHEGGNKGYGAKHLAEHNDDIRTHTYHENWQELLGGFFRALSQAPKDLKSGEIYSYTDGSGRSVFLWDDPQFTAPVTIVMDARTDRDIDHYSVITAYPSEQYVQPPGAENQRRGIPPLHGNPSARAFMDYLRPEVAKRFTDSQQIRGAVGIGTEHHNALETSALEAAVPAKGSRKNIFQALFSGSDALVGSDEKKRDLIDRLRSAIFDKNQRIWRAGKMAAGALADLANTSAHAAALAIDKAAGYFSATMKYGQLVYRDGVSSVENVTWYRKDSSGEYVLDDNGNRIVDHVGLRNRVIGKFYDKDTDQIVEREVESDIYENGGDAGLLAILNAISIQNKNIVREFFGYLIALRGYRLSKEGKKIPISQEHMKTLLGFADKHPEIAVVAANYNAWNDGLIDFQMETGVIDKEMARVWRETADYVPYFVGLEGGTTDAIDAVVEALEGLDSPTFIDSIVGVSQPKKLKGHELELMEPIEALSKNSMAAITAGLRNVAAQRTIRDALKIGWATALPKRPTDPAVDYVRIRQNGEEKFYHVTDRLMYEAITGALKGYTPFSSILSTPSKWLRELVTRTPEFMVANMMRDSLSVWVVNQGDADSKIAGDFTPIISSFNRFGRSLKAWKRGEVTETYKMLEKHGVIGGYELSRLTDKEMKRYFAKQMGADKKTPGTELLSKAWDGLGEASARSEAATREIIFESTYQRVLNEQLRNNVELNRAQRIAQGEAAFQATEILNFSRHGNAIWLRWLTSVIPFMNSRLQGLDVMYRNIAGMSAQRSSPDAIRKSLIMRGLLLSGMTMAYTMLLYDDEEYQNQRPEVRDDYWLIPMPGGGFFSLPIPFEAGVIFKVLPEMFTRMLMGGSSREFRQSAAHAVGSTLNFNPIPQAVKPALESFVNYNFFTGREIVPHYMENMVGGYGARASTSLPAQGLGRLTGTSPLKWENLFRGYAGGVGAYALQAMDSSMRLLPGVPGKPMPRLTDMPLFRRFLRDEFEGGLKAQYYGLKNSIDGIVTTINYLEKKDPEAALEMRVEYAGMLSMKPMVQGIDKKLKVIRDRKNQVMNSDMGMFDKREMIDMLERQENLVLSNMGIISKMADY